VLNELYGARNRPRYFFFILTFCFANAYDCIRVKLNPRMIRLPCIKMTMRVSQTMGCRPFQGNRQLHILVDVVPEEGPKVVLVRNSPQFPEPPDRTTKHLLRLPTTCCELGFSTSTEIKSKKRKPVNAEPHLRLNVPATKPTQISCCKVPNNITILTDMKRFLLLLLLSSD
jgi:hypothetical protein